MSNSVLLYDRYQLNLKTVILTDSSYRFKFEFVERFVNTARVAPFSAKRERRLEAEGNHSCYTLIFVGRFPLIVSRLSGRRRAIRHRAIRHAFHFLWICWNYASVDNYWSFASPGCEPEIVDSNWSDFDWNLNSGYLTSRSCFFVASPFQFYDGHFLGDPHKHC